MWRGVGVWVNVSICHFCSQLFSANICGSDQSRRLRLETHLFHALDLLSPTDQPTNQPRPVLPFYLFLQAGHSGGPAIDRVMYLCLSVDVS